MHLCFGPLDFGFITKMASSDTDSSDESTDDDVQLEAEVPAGTVSVARAKITRKRSVRSTGGKYGKRGKSDVKNVSLHDRITQFPNQNLTIREGKLFCNACRELVSTKKSILGNHVISKKHTKSKEELLKSKTKTTTIIEAFKAAENKQMQDSTLPMNEQAFCAEVVEDFLKAGIPIYKIDTLRPLLEKHGSRLTHSSHLRDYIPHILKKEIDQVKKEIASPSNNSEPSDGTCAQKTRDLSVIFDGSTRQGEAIVIIVRFIDDNWNIQQRLLKIDICAKSVNAYGLAQVLNESIS